MVRIWILNKNAAGVNWGAWIKDTVTDEETLIGIINLKNNIKARKQFLASWQT